MGTDKQIKRVGITGGTGAIGLALTEECVRRGIEAYVFVRRDSARIGRIPEHPLVHRIYCALDEMKGLDVKDIPTLDVFYHFAWMKAFGEEARNDLITQIRNTEYAVESVGLAKRLGCFRYIGAGSQAEYGRKNGALKSDTPCDPENGYGIAKLAAGQLTRLECEKQGMEHIWTRVLSVYGPGDGDGTLVMSVIKDALEGRAPACTRAEQIWDYLYSGDAGKAFLMLGNKGVPGKTYVLGSGKALPLREHIDRICEASAEISGIKQVSPDYGARPYGEKQVMYLLADTGELAKDTGFEPDTSFDEGIRKTIAWVRERSGVKETGNNV